MHQMILATKSYEITVDSDTAYLLDADLAILGQSPEEYYGYTEKIREEYSIYPDLIYKPGRKKVIRHFLEKERIFQSEHFYSKFEEQAFTNLKAELETLEN